MTLISAETLTTQTATSFGSGFSNERTVKANCAPPEAFRRLSEDHVRFIAVDADEVPLTPRRKFV